MLLPGWLSCLLHRGFQFCCWKRYTKWFLEHRRHIPTGAGAALYPPQLVSSAETQGWGRARRASTTGAGLRNRVPHQRVPGFVPPAFLTHDPASLRLPVLPPATSWHEAPEKQSSPQQHPPPPRPESDCGTRKPQEIIWEDTGEKDRQTPAPRISVRCHQTHQLLAQTMPAAPRVPAPPPSHHHQSRSWMLFHMPFVDAGPGASRSSSACCSSCAPAVPADRRGLGSRSGQA